MGAEICVVCRPTSVPGEVVEGSTVAQCGRCGCDVWLAPSSRLIPFDMILCPACAVAETVGEEERQWAVTVASLHEAAAHLAKRRRRGN